ncbi:MAG: ABC transporter ATP-binding protein [Anaerovoracaceae bacterium]|nr:ABC transporter ATP-binding protein [Bacillota bacterium]MDY5770579.1 ABC transporter ATP-binding protein [Anaerovoracaceae bacterium]
MSERKTIIQIEHLSKSFGDLKAVDDLSFNVKEGELFAFLGVNGAGKSTTISIMCGQQTKDSGKVFIGGKDLDESTEGIKRELGVVFQNSVLDKALSVRDNLRYRAALYGITGAVFEKRLAELAELLDFADLMKRTVGKLSGGQRRRIDIARALLHSPEILILDEPTTGLDPQTRKLLWGAVSRLRKEQNMTVFLTTHYMEEAADADYVIILDSGRIVAEGTPLQLKNKYTGDFITLYGATEDEARLLGTSPEKIPGAYRIEVEDTAHATELIIKHPEIFRDYEITKGKMDDIFLAATGKRLTGGENGERA